MAVKLTGTLTGNVVLTFPLPGEYIVRNNCTVGAFYVQVRALGTGNLIGLPPGHPIKIWNDGTDCDFLNLGLVGSAVDLHTNTTTLPAWMTACSVLPYLIKNGGEHTSSVYPALAAQLGSTYGGNGSTSFGVPDEMNRIRLPVDSIGSNTRVTQAISGINGTTFNSSGGNQSLQAHLHGNSLSDPSHTHANSVGSPLFVVDGGTAAGIDNSGNAYNKGSLNNAVTGITINNATTGAGGSQNMPPAIVDFLPLIKT
jgi:microcystin-dependent protein